LVGRPGREHHAPTLHRSLSSASAHCPLVTWSDTPYAYSSLLICPTRTLFTKHAVPPPLRTGEEGERDTHGTGEGGVRESARQGSRWLHTHHHPLQQGAALAASHQHTSTERTGVSVRHVPSELRGLTVDVTNAQDVVLGDDGQLRVVLLDSTGNTQSGRACWTPF
jgi:hypothetical protein